MTSHMKKETYTQEDYKSVLNQTANSIEALIQELDTEIVNNFHKHVKIEYRHDIVPVIKRLKEALKEVKFSQSVH